MEEEKIGEAFYKVGTVKKRESNECRNSKQKNLWKDILRN